MAYKTLGFLVWQGGKWYARRKLGGKTSRVAMAGVGAAVLAGVVAAGRGVARSA